MNPYMLLTPAARRGAGAELTTGLFVAAGAYHAVTAVERWLKRLGGFKSA